MGSPTGRLVTRPSIVRNAVLLIGEEADKKLTSIDFADLELRVLSAFGNAAEGTAFHRQVEADMRRLQDRYMDITMEREDAKAVAAAFNGARRFGKTEAVRKITAEERDFYTVGKPKKPKDKLPPSWPRNDPLAQAKRRAQNKARSVTKRKK